MSLTYGFYNSKNHDRRYNAIQMSSIFDGIILDGIFMTIGDRFQVTQSSGMMINVGSGRAWFNHTWTLNDALLPLTVPESEVLLNRIDAVILEINAEQSVRENSIKIIKGTPSSNPVRPTLTKTETVHQYALAYIQVNARATEIRTANITSMIGTGDTPYVTGPLKTIDIESMVAQWEDQWKEFFEKQTVDMETANSFWKEQWRTWFIAQTGEINEAYLTWEAQWNDWFEKQTSEMTETNNYWKQLWINWFYEYTNQNQQDWSDWKRDAKERFEIWFEQLQIILDGDVAANLANRITDLENRTTCLEQFKEDLVTEFSIYSSLYDSDNEKILDSNGNPIRARVLFVAK